MGRIIALVNQKGGVGKTTSAVNIAASVGILGKSVLLIDLDPQGNTTSGVGINKKNLKSTSYELLIDEIDAAQAIVETEFKNLSVIPSNISLAGAEFDLYQLDNREYRLKKQLEAVKDNYDYIFIDCPPSLELLTLNALCAANSLLVPVQGEYYALEGLSDLMNTVRIVRRSMNPSLDIEGVLLTMFDGRTNLSIQVAQEVKRFFGSKVYSTVIPRNVRLSEAPSHGRPITAYDRNCRGADAYIALADEFLKRNA